MGTEFITMPYMALNVELMIVGLFFFISGFVIARNAPFYIWLPLAIGAGIFAAVWEDIFAV